MVEVRPWTWGWLVACQLAKGTLATVLCLGLWGALPAAIGWEPTTVSSGSMLPRLRVGDVAVSRPLHGTPPTVGSVLLFDDPDHPGRLRMHRFVRVDDDGQLVTRGDANAGDDSSPIGLAAVHGVGTLRVPWVALPVVWVREGAWVRLALCALALAALTAVAAHSRAFGFAEADDGSDDPPGGDADPGDEAASDPVPGPAGQQRATGPRGAVVRIRTPLAAAAGALLLGLVPAVPAGAAFSATTRNTGNSLTAAPYFRCSGAVAALSPYLYFRMDESSSTATTAVDSSSSSRNGVYGQTGKTTTTDRACAHDTGQAMVFDGTSGYLSSAQIAGSAPDVFTEAIWFKTTTTSGGKLVGLGNVQTGPSGQFDRHIYMTDDGHIVFGVYSSGFRTVTSPNTYRNGSWHQVVGTLSTTGLRLYLDGNLVAADTTTTVAEPVSGSYVRFGYDNLDGWPSAPTSRYFAGTLDDAVFYLSALTASQVSTQYQVSA